MNMLDRIAALRERLNDIYDDRHFPAHLLSAHEEMCAVLDELIALTTPKPEASQGEEPAEAEVERLREQNRRLCASLEEILVPLERAAAAMVAEGKVPDQNAEAAFDRARAALSTKGEGK